MRFNIRHETHYNYNQAVYLNPHIIRLRPRSDPFLRLLRFSYRIEPRPAMQTEFLDLYGNSVMQACFDEPTESFHVESNFEVEALRVNPFDFIITDSGVVNLPVHYNTMEALSLESYLVLTVVSTGVRDFTRDVIIESGNDTIGFLCTLARMIQQQIKYVKRPMGPAHSGTETLLLKSGSCRDLAMLFIDVCRAQGLAARFVSGFCAAMDGTTESELHAWVEVYLPGGGWRGFDPSMGLATADRHIPIAAHPSPEGADPITGFILGKGVTSVMTTQVEIHDVLLLAV
jgi:transglutaminase-like putative cysteine protease